MNYVRMVIDWIKANPVGLACIVVALLSLGSFYYPTHAKGAAFVQEMKGRSAEVTKITGLMNSTLSVPAQNSDDKPKEVPGLPTEADIKELKRIYDSIKVQYGGVQEFVLSFNRDHHEPVVDHNGKAVFPLPQYNDSKSDGRYELARRLEALYMSLDPQEALTTESRNKRIESLEQSYMNSVFPVLKTLDGEHKVKAAKFVADKLQAEFKQQALNAHIYAPRTRLRFTGEPWEPGALHVEQFLSATESAIPHLSDLWEVQLQLWLQEDIVDALRKANHIGNDPAAADFHKTSVVDAPVKELNLIQVADTYVGLRSPTGGGGQMGLGAAAGAAGAPTPLTDDQADKEIREGIKPDFLRSQSSTGRYSNALYDVHHVRLVVVVDYKRVPELFEALRKTNYIAVMNIAEVDDIDEYQRLREGYFYGDGVDAVRLDLLLEVVYLRTWTAGHNSPEYAKKLNEPFVEGFMPDISRREYGLPTRAKEIPNKVLVDEGRSQVKYIGSAAARTSPYAEKSGQGGGGPTGAPARPLGPVSPFPGAGPGR